MLVSQAKNGPLVLFVDDLHLLDTTSATFVCQLVDADLVFLVSTVRSDAPLPSGLDALWIAPLSGASISRTSIGLQSTLCCTSCCAARSR